MLSAMDEYRSFSKMVFLVIGEGWVGHSSLKTTSTYSHSTKDFREDIASKLAG
jgi:hypothetical protein